MGVDASLLFEGRTRGVWHFFAEALLKRDWQLIQALGYPSLSRPSDLNIPVARGLPIDVSPVSAAWLKDLGYSHATWLDEAEFRRVIAWHVQHADPRSDKRPGFVPIEREWLEAATDREFSEFADLIVPSLMENCGKGQFAEFDAWRVLIRFDE